MSKKYRLKAAVILAALYAFCILAPHAALALTSAAVHCLAGENAAAHVHHGKADAGARAAADGAAHHHSEGGAPHKHSGADEKAHGGNCCGLFCISALVHEPSFAITAPPATGRAIPPLADVLDGRGPDHINRPPIA